MFHFILVVRFDSLDSLDSVTSCAHPASHDEGYVLRQLETNRLLLVQEIVMVQVQNAD
jgi:hypothetical protein